MADGQGQSGWGQVRFHPLVIAAFVPVARMYNLQGVDAIARTPRGCVPELNFGPIGRTSCQRPCAPARMQCTAMIRASVSHNSPSPVSGPGEGIAPQKKPLVAIGGRRHADAEHASHDGRSPTPWQFRARACQDLRRHPLERPCTDRDRVMTLLQVYRNNTFLLRSFRRLCSSRAWPVRRTIAVSGRVPDLGSSVIEQCCWGTAAPPDQTVGDPVEPCGSSDAGTGFIETIRLPPAKYPYSVLCSTRTRTDCRGLECRSQAAAPSAATPQNRRRLSNSWEEHDFRYA